MDWLPWLARVRCVQLKGAGGKVVVSVRQVDNHLLACVQTQQSKRA